MQTNIAAPFKDTADGREAEEILRACVHCGFCTATCPTYQLVGDELDGPRGRIYLMKMVLEGEAPSRRTQLHLDRCLTCRACETTCPSGVRYGRLVDIGRGAVDAQVQRPLVERAMRRALRAIVPHPKRFGFFYKLGRMVPSSWSGGMCKAPMRTQAATWPANQGLERKMLALDGCVQSVATPATNAAAARVLAKLGVELVRAEGAGCCGAISHHLTAPGEAGAFMRRNIDAWWPHIEAGAEALVMTASGCGAMVREYGHLLRDDAGYAARAARVSELTRDLGEILARENLQAFAGIGHGRRIAWHSPCTLQHGQKVVGVVERILRTAGFELVPVRDSHLCCGSAGTYSLLQKKLSEPLLRNKLGALQEGHPAVIATANIGCQLHLGSAAAVPVHHWIELLDEPGLADS
ncbi:MAG: glycolate oxidase subunit GlcF [Xanthomonadales bacterium]|nr:glycolate oxidase subunit GlcF [Xanthomonadales bacterium]ODU95171.1 MAG: glycolate oxidase iron-sulfur subunit [Rhodanobacter sp. SCN 66-43]OJY82900.1 MAG: glycolate oxidase iron-sulfur subunit [Xanthomonadales bacterium 66-474]